MPRRSSARPTTVPTGTIPTLITSDEYPAYETAIRRTYDEPVGPKPAGAPGRRPIVPGRRVPEGLNYTTVHKGVGEGSGRGDRHSGDSGDVLGRGWGLGALEDEPDNQHLVRGAVPRDGLALKQARSGY